MTQPLTSYTSWNYVNKSDIHMCFTFWCFGVILHFLEKLHKSAQDKIFNHCYFYYYKKQYDKVIYSLISQKMWFIVLTAIGI